MAEKFGQLTLSDRYARRRRRAGLAEFWTAAIAPVPSEQRFGSHGLSLPFASFSRADSIVALLIMRSRGGDEV